MLNPENPTRIRWGRIDVWSDGTFLPVVSGGSGGQGDGGDAQIDEPDDSGGGNQPKPGDVKVTRTQAEIDASAAAIRREAERRAKKDAEKALSEALGVPIEEAKQIIAERKTAQEAAATEAEKREAAATKREADALARESAAVAKERAADAKVALLEAGVNPERLKRATAMLLGDLDADADEESITTAAAALKTEMPELFGATQRGNGAPTGDPSGGSSNPGGNGQPIGIEAGRARARAQKAAKTQDPNVDPFGAFQKIG